MTVGGGKSLRIFCRRRMLHSHRAISVPVADSSRPGAKRLHGANENATRTSKFGHDRPCARYAPRHGLGAHAGRPVARAKARVDGRVARLVV